MKDKTPIIGMEIHIELSTDSKMFCGCVNKHYMVKPNSHTCPVCLGLPGALPVPNRKAVDWTLLIGLALNCKIRQESKFDRKHYFYPDLPKGYQISQYDEPLCENGFIDTSDGRINITRVHLEEDTGKLVHRKVNGKNVSLIDFNRSGVPLVEIVTEPDIHSGKQAKELTKKLQQLLRYLNVSDCDMEKGSMRLEANISWGMDLGYKVEVKNLNSFRFVERAIDYELLRQKKMLDSGKTPRQETRGWSEKKNKTVSQRFKETAADYRYFPEPDIPPMKFSTAYIDALKNKLPILPDVMIENFQSKYHIKKQYVVVLKADKQRLEYADQALKIAVKEKVDLNDVASAIVNKKIDINNLSPKKLIDQIKSQISVVISDDKTLKAWVLQAMNELPEAVEDYRTGKVSAISALIGKVMQLSKGKAQAKKVKQLLEKKL